jgi:hypothetical protein
MASIRILRKKATATRRVFRKALVAYNHALAKYAAARRAAGCAYLPPKFFRS